MMSAERMAGRVMPARVMVRLGPRLAGLDAMIASGDETSVSARFALFAFFVRVLSAAIMFLSQILLARWMGSFEFGIFVFVAVASVILGGLSCLGFQTAVIRFAPEYRLGAQHDLLRGILLTSRLFALGSAGLVACLGLVLIVGFRDVLPAYYLKPLVIGALCLPVMALSEVLDGTSRAHALAGLAVVPTFIVRPLLILVFMAIGVGCGAAPDAVTASASLFCAVLATVLGQLVLVDRKAKRQTGPGPRRIVFRTWFLMALPIFLVEGFFNLLTNVDILMVGHFQPPEQVAVYYASVKTLALVYFVSFAVKAGAAQRFAQYRHSGDSERYEAFIRATIGWTFWSSLVVAVFLAICGPFLLALFGPDFAKGAPLLFILIAGVLARATVGPAESVLTMSGEQKACAALYFATILYNISANIVLIPIFGLYGAAVATASAMVFEAAALHLVARRRLGLVMFVFARPGIPNRREPVR